MSNVNRLNGRILTLERERDELVRANFKLRDFLLKKANECESCGGKGVVTVLVPRREEPCGDCLDIRAVLDQ